MGKRNLNIYGKGYRRIHLIVFSIASLILLLLFTAPEITKEIYSGDKRKYLSWSLSIIVPFVNLNERYGINNFIVRTKSDFHNGITWGVKKERPVKRIYKPGEERRLLFSQRHPFKVFLGGDSLAGSVNMTLAPMTENLNTIEVTTAHEVASTLTNTRAVDWIEKLRRELRLDGYHLIIFYLGANSTQAVRYQNAAPIPFFDKRWEKAYGERVEKLIRIAQESGAEVWWIESPPMSNAPYNKDILTVNRVIENICEKTGIVYLSINDIFGDANGEFMSHKIIGGKSIALRSRDGIHFSIDGSRLISNRILNRIEEEYQFTNPLLSGDKFN